MSIWGKIIIDLFSLTANLAFLPIFFKALIPWSLLIGIAPDLKKYKPITGKKINVLFKTIEGMEKNQCKKQFPKLIDV